jgi:hypothetical protein
MELVSGTGQDLHTHGVADGNFFRQQFIYEKADWRTGVAEEFNPGRSVDQYHNERPERIASKSPSQPAPRRARASSKDNDSAATIRRAKLTASRLVVMR